MSYTIKPFYCLWVEFDDQVIDIDAGKQLIVTILTSVHKDLRKTILIDLRKSSFHDNFKNFNEFISKLDNIGLSQDVNIAFVCKEGDQFQELFIHRAKKKGFQYEAFLSIEEAINWLRVAT